MHCGKTLLERSKKRVINTPNERSQKTEHAYSNLFGEHIQNKHRKQHPASITHGQSPQLAVIYFLVISLTILRVLLPLETLLPTSTASGSLLRLNSRPPSSSSNSRNLLTTFPSGLGTASANPRAIIEQESKVSKYPGQGHEE